MHPILKHPLLRPLRVAYSARRHPAGFVLLWLFRGRSIHVYDVGAHFGNSTEKYANWFPSASFDMFEADPTIADLCKRRMLPAPRVRLHTFACGDTNGTAIFHSTASANDLEGGFEGGASGSLLEPSGISTHFPHVVFQKSIEVQVRRLDTWIEESGTPPPTFLHLDVQGAEMLVLNGLGIHFNAIEAVWLEVENQELYANQPLKPDIESFFVSRGWTKVVDTVGTVYGDQLWVSPASFQKLRGWGWKFHKTWYSPVFQKLEG